MRAGRSCRGRGLRPLRLPAKSAQAARQNHDGDGSFSDAGTHRGRWWHLTDAQFSTIANLDDAAVLQERVMYDSYGRALHRDDKDVDGDRDFDSTDRGIVNTLATATPSGTAITSVNYNADGDLDRDGDVDNTDLTLIGTSYVSALAAGKVSNTTVKNTIGWDGYVFNGEVAGAGLYHVRFRLYSPEVGRWLERDPGGYVDGMALYAYARLMPITFTDPTGLETPPSLPRPVIGLEADGTEITESDPSCCADYLKKKYPHRLYDIKKLAGRFGTLVGDFTKEHGENDCRLAFLHAQLCILNKLAEGACCAGGSESYKYEDWLYRVLNVFMSSLMNAMEGRFIDPAQDDDWQLVESGSAAGEWWMEMFPEEGTPCDDVGPSLVRGFFLFRSDDLYMARKMALTHINFDLAMALRTQGIGHEEDWNCIGDVVNDCAAEEISIIVRGAGVILGHRFGLQTFDLSLTRDRMRQGIKDNYEIRDRCEPCIEPAQE